MDLDEGKITGDDGDIYFMQWLTKMERELHEADAATIKIFQSDLEKVIIKTVSGIEPYPKPGRSLRAVASRCLLALYQRGETRSLFDTMTSFLRIAGDMKTADRDQSKVAAFYCMGEIMATFGAQNMSFMAEIAVLSLRNFKSSSSSILLKYHSMIALRKALTAAGRAVNESVLKDILKQAKSGLTDKVLPIQRAASEILVVLHPIDDGNRSTTEIETIVSLCVKSLDNADQLTRRALAKLVGHILASSQSTKIIPPPDLPKKNKKDSNEDDSEVAAPTSAAPDTVKTIMTVSDMLSQLSTPFNKPNASKKLRIGIFDFYITLFTILGSSFVESNYAAIVKHFFTEIVQGSRNQSSRYETLLVRKLVGTVLRDLIGARLLSEQGQIGAIRELSNTYLKKWPALLPRQVAPDAPVLVIALKEVAGLIIQLGNAPPSVQDALFEPLITLLAHPSHGTRVAAAWALRCFCYSTPLLLSKVIFQLIDLLQKDIRHVVTPSAPSDIQFRAIGHAYGLSAIFAVIPDRPLYVSHDVSAKVLDLAIQLLKRAGEHDLNIANIEVEVAWTLIASLMSLGPNFVRSHLPQLLVLWRNALPKPTSKDTSSGSGRSIAEWTFLIHVRECALGAILCFLHHNSPSLVTLDVARRLASLLSNGLSFSNAVTSQKFDEFLEPSMQTGQRDTSILFREARLRRRAFQCFTALGSAGLGDTVQITLIQSAIASFAGADMYGVSAMTAAINASAGNFTSVWQAADGYGYGVTTICNKSDVQSGFLIKEKADRLNRDILEVIIDDMLNAPAIGSCEHDPIVLCQSKAFGDLDWPEPPPSTSAAANAAIELFALLLPQQDLSSTTRLINELIESVHSPRFEKNLGRKAAVHINAVIALDLAFKQAASSQARQGQEVLGSPQLSSTLSMFLKEAILDGDLVLRNAGSDAIGRLASLSGTNFLAGQIKTLVDIIVNNRDPYARAGCALTFGAIYTHVGSLVAGPLLKTTVNILMSLGNDPHPVVHYWAMTALSQVIDSASLAYAPFVSSTLGMLFKLLISESHEPEGGGMNSVNIKGGLPLYQVLCQVIDAIINVLGPDIQDSARTRTLLLDLVHEFLLDADEGICVESIKCIQHFLIFATESVDIPDLVVRLKAHLSSSRRPLRIASINALYQLVQKDALMMSKVGGDRLVEDLFGMLDTDATIDGVRDVIKSWLRQTVVHNPSAWIDLCQRNMSRDTGIQRANTKATGPMDDEGESLSVGMGQGASSDANSASRWRTQLFALQCLHEICSLVAQSGRREHIDIPFAVKQGLQVKTLLASRIPDLIKMAFTASAAYVMEIRLQGLVVLRDVIEVFAKSPDPDYEDSLLLEQHQAPITAALTPAFTADSTPEILASAVEVCGVFVGCGIVKDVSRMGRILKLLTSGLEQSKESGTLSLGDAEELSPNASVMLRISTLSAWAELQVARVNQPYLIEVIKPHEAVLATLWVASLRDYASIRADSEVLLESGSAVSDSPYSGLGREVLLPYYNQSWPAIMQAVGTAMQLGDPYVHAAMDGRDPSAQPSQSLENDNGRDEPTLMFYPLFGLVYEALASSSSDTSASSSKQNTLICLQVLLNLVKPAYSGKALLEPTIFEEFTSLCYRMAVTESASVQILLVRVIASFASSQGRSRLVPPELNGHVADGIPPESPLTHCLRMCSSVLQQVISSHESSRNYADDNPKDRIELVRAAFTAFMQISEIFGPSFKEDSRAVAVALYAELLKNEKSSIDLAGPTLQILKELLDNAPQPKMQDEFNHYSRLIHGLLSATLINIDDMRGREGTISTMKVKNNLLAAVLILTVVPSTVQLSEAAVEHCCYLICEKLMDSKEISLTACHCAKTLIITGTAGNPVLQYCTKALFPGLIEYIAGVAALADDVSKQNEHLGSIEEILKALSTFFNSVQEAYRPRLLGVLLPTLTLLLDPSRSPAASVHIAVVGHLLSFATTSSSAFKEATEKMDSAAKETLESSIRHALGSRATANARTAAKPQISLRSF